MDKFWDWMKSEGKLSDYELSNLAFNDIVISGKDVIYIRKDTKEKDILQKQMLVGYMIEYCQEYFKSISYSNYKKSLACDEGFFKTPYVECVFRNALSYKDTYTQLKEVICLIETEDRRYD